MSTEYAGRGERLHTAEVFRDKWVWLVLLGGVLIAAGAAAILVPAVSEIAASKVLGSVLIISGILQIMQAAKMLNWIGFIWHMLLGILAAIGGALIYMDPFAGVIAITILIAIIFAFHGVTQIAFAREGPPPGRMALVPGVRLHRPAGERAAGDEASLQSFVHAGDAGRRFASVRRLGLCRHRADVAESRNDQLTAKSRECAIAAMQIWTSAASGRNTIMDLIEEGGFAVVF